MAMPQGQVPTFAESALTDDVDESQTAARSDRISRRLKMPTWLAILWENKKSRIGLIMLTAFLLVAIFAPLIAPHDPRANDFPSNLGSSRDNLLGTTTSGEDIFSQLIWGARTSLIVGLVGGLLATIIALIVGMTAGYMGGVVDDVLMFATNLALVVPILPLIILLAAYSSQRGLVLIIFIIGITGWAGGALLKRSQMVTLRSRDYITAAVFAGDGRARIIFKEIMPNMTSLVVVGFLGSALGAIGAEAGLSFLGFGDPNTVSWGTISYWANSQGALVTGQWLWLLAPGLALSFLIMSLTLINFGIDALSNPHLREE